MSKKTYKKKNKKNKRTYKNYKKRVKMVKKDDQNIKAFVINLDKRTDRWNTFQENFKDTGINIKRVDAIKHETGWMGCALSHIKAIKEAKTQGLASVLIMEDDVIPTSEFKIYWPKIRKWLDNHKDKWDFFSGGNSYYAFNPKLENDIKSLCKLDGIHIYKSPILSFQCYYLNSSVYDTFINLESSIFNSGWNPIDFWPNNQHMKTISCTPFLTRQLNDFSNIENTVRNYDTQYNTSEKLIATIPNLTPC